MSRALLCSGGLDSVALWRLLGCPSAVYCPLGHRYQSLELATLSALEHHSIATGIGFTYRQVAALTLAPYERPDGFIPLRNLLLLCVAALDDTVDTLYLGALRGETGRDKTRRFARSLSRLLTFLLARPITVEFPASGMTKTGLLRRYLQQFPTPADRVFLLASRSCYTETTYDDTLVGCGACQSCFRRWVALTNNGLTQHFRTWPGSYHQMNQGELQNVWSELWHMPIRTWPAIAENNLDALRAILKARRGAP